MKTTERLLDDSLALNEIRQSDERFKVRFGPARYGRRGVVALWRDGLTEGTQNMLRAAIGSAEHITQDDEMRWSAMERCFHSYI